MSLTSVGTCDSLDWKLETSNNIFLELVYKKLILTLRPKLFQRVLQQNS